jgi:hypothetical protein
MAANSPENPVPMIKVSEYRGCLGLLANAGFSSVAGCADALIVESLYRPVDRGSPICLSQAGPADSPGRLERDLFQRAIGNTCDSDAPNLRAGSQGKRSKAPVNMARDASQRKLTGH